MSLVLQSSGEKRFLWPELTKPATCLAPSVLTRRRRWHCAWSQSQPRWLRPGSKGMPLEAVVQGNHRQSQSQSGRPPTSPRSSFRRWRRKKRTRRGLPLPWQPTEFLAVKRLLITNWPWSQQGMSVIIQHISINLFLFRYHKHNFLVARWIL